MILQCDERATEVDERHDEEDEAVHEVERGAVDVVEDDAAGEETQGLGTGHEREQRTWEEKISQLNLTTRTRPLSYRGRYIVKMYFFFKFWNIVCLCLFV